MTKTSDNLTKIRRACEKSDDGFCTKREMMAETGLTRNQVDFRINLADQQGLLRVALRPRKTRFGYIRNEPCYQILESK